MDLVFATNNKHKIKEIQDVLGNGFRLLSLKELGCFDELPETHETLEENSSEKAWYVHSKFKCDCFADDTGLEIAALNGEPGVYSARYVGESSDFSSEADRFNANIDKVLQNLKGVDKRDACFRTVISLIIKGQEYRFEGRVDGIILPGRKGNEGFGYDPIFQPRGFTTSFAEMSLQQKNSISHRADAVKKLNQFLLSYQVK
jgi:XTP/dITP diphosphohydrolase